MAAHEFRSLIVHVALPLHAGAFASSRHVAALEPNAEHAGAVDRSHGEKVVVPTHRGLDHAIWPPECIGLTLVERHCLHMSRRVRVDVDNHLTRLSRAPGPSRKLFRHPVSDRISGEPGLSNPPPTRC